MKSKKYSFVLIIIMIGTLLYAAGKKEQGEYTKVDGLKTWSATQDISKLSDGKYNIVVKGEDTAGNTTIAGPYNFYISAESDLTTINIANPVPNMIVSDNLNVVGDALDDDGVKRVELKLDDGFYQKCKGTAFWSYYLDLKDMKEGPHVITIRGTDINGLAGIEKSVNFTVDKEPPVVRIVSYKQGSVLKGKVNILGEATDAGGIDQIAFSEDGQANYKKLKMSYNKKSKAWEFSQTINTNKMEDGTYNYWYRSVDLSGAVGISSFLFFVDNHSPELTVIEPVNGATLNGTVGFSGKITDTIGVKSLNLKIGSEVKPVELIPGNPYWAIQIDLQSESSGKLIVEFEAEDFAGNIRTRKIKLNNDASSDLPVVSLFVPEKVGVLQKTINVGISITDDDGVKGYKYFLDQNEPVFVETRNTSVLALNEMTPGKHSLKVIPFDINDTAGKAVTGVINVPKVSTKKPEQAAPVISLNNPVSGVTVKEGVTLTGTVSLAVDISTLEYLVADDPESDWVSIFVDTSTGKFTKDIPSSAMSDGNHIVELKAIDAEGNSSIAYTSFTKDSQAPVLKLLTPVKDDTVNGRITVSGIVSDISPVFSYEFSADGTNYKPLGNSKFFSFNFDYSAYKEKPDVLYFRTEDDNKNIKEYSFPFKVNSKIDIPVVAIQFPAENSTLTGKASISGTALDDDGIKAIYYAFDTDDFKVLEGSNTFSIPVPFSKLEDSNHSVRIKAEDINGVFSKVAVRKFIISRTGPVLKVEEPSPESYINGSYAIKGTAEDSNGIASVSISIDNGTSYTNAGGREKWSYLLDTSLLHDGTHSVYVKAMDKAGTSSIYSTIINVDNTPPVIKLDSPVNGGKAGSLISFDGRVKDNTLLESLSLEVQTLEQTKEGLKPLTIDLDPASFMHYNLKTGNLSPGWYNIRMEAVDAAGNVSNETRSVNILSPEERGKISIMYPLEGEDYNAFLKVQGVVEADTLPESVVVIIDENVVGTADVTESGYFKLTLDSSLISSGTHNVEVRSSEIGTKIKSSLRRFSFNEKGPWILFDQSFGDFLTSRTFITGTLGYETGDGTSPPKVKDFSISYDNGHTFASIKANNEWKARIETEEYPDGNLPVLARLIYEDGSSTVVKMTLEIDKTPPKVSLDSSMEGKSYNNSILLLGSASDNTDVKDILYLLRAGDKNSYEIPSFIQGLYLDMHALGATYGELGAGLTFFDDNVKLQFQVGLAPPGRFSGIVLGGKLLANIVTVPYSFLFGPDWQNFSMAAAVGATFSYFTMSDNGFSLSGQGVVLGSIIGQMELIKYTIPDLSMFNTYSLYIEGSLWFISSDIQAGVVPRYSIGTRIGVF